MQVIHQLWKGRRVRVAGVLDQVAVDCPDDLAGIYQQYWELVYRRCYATLKDHEAALDATQDVFVHALHSFEDIQNDVVRGLVDLARTISYERKRRPSREVMLAEPPRNGHAADDPAEIAESHRMLASVWSGLSDVERRYLADKFAGFSFEEIARRNRRALGTVSSNLARAREHARRMREPLLPGVLALAAWRRLTDLSRRARSVASDTSLAAAAQPVGTFTVSLTVASIIAGAVPATSAALAAAPRSHLALAAAGLPDIDAGTTMAGALVGQKVQVASQSSVARPSSQTQGTSALPGILPSRPASAETPDDMQVSTATPSPNYDRDHTIVALGRGAGCACQALLMTTDGGATWQATSAPPRGDQIVLPPAFPQDPAIYVGYSSGQAGLTNFWSPHFGAPFEKLDGLPSGELSLPAGFDSGDPRVFASTPTGVWSRNLATGSLQPQLVETQDATPATATPLRDPSLGLLALTSSQALGATASSLSTGNSDTLWSCPPAQSCTALGTVPLLPGARLVVSSHVGGDGTILAYQTGSLYASTDGGHSFSAIDMPWNHAMFDALMATPTASGVALWSVVPRGSGFAVMVKPSLSAPWVEADGGNRGITAAGGSLVVVGAQRQLFFPAQGGLLCSVNGGVTWEARCPSA